MKRERGMTLVEVLCALVLLSALAAASLPLLVQAHRVAREPKAPFGAFELGRLADALLADPKSFGLEEVPDEAQVSWPDHPERPAVQLRRVLVGDPPTHSWRIFECGKVAVSRWEEAPRP